MVEIWTRHSAASKIELDKSESLITRQRERISCIANNILADTLRLRALRSCYCWRLDPKTLKSHRSRMSIESLTLSSLPPRKWNIGVCAGVSIPDNFFVMFVTVYGYLSRNHYLCFMAQGWSSSLIKSSVSTIVGPWQLLLNIGQYILHRLSSSPFPSAASNANLFHRP